jgi:hypothetical protein
MNWLLPHSIPPLSCQKVVSLSQSSCVSRAGLIDSRGGGERGAKSYDGEKALVIYKSFNTPWVSYIGQGDKREQRKRLRAELRQDVSLPNVTQVRDVDEDLINAINVKM